MTDSLRQQIVDAVDIRFKTILQRNGYMTDLEKIFSNGGIQKKILFLHQKSLV